MCACTYGLSYKFWDQRVTKVITNYVRRFFDVYVVLCGGLLIDNAAWLRSSLLLIDIKRAKLYWNVVSESSPDRGLKCLFLQTDSGISLKKIKYTTTKLVYYAFAAGKKLWRMIQEKPDRGRKRETFYRHCVLFLSRFSSEKLCRRCRKPSHRIFEYMCV